MSQSNGNNGRLKDLSVNFFDLALRSNTIRKIALKKGNDHLYDFFVVKNKDKIPGKIQEMRYLALTNLLHSVNKALSDGRIGSHVRKEIIKEFIGNVITGEHDRQQPFREKYGFNPPSFLTISPTKKCNLACKGCYAASSTKNDNTMDYQVFQRILDEKKNEWGSHFTVISGGEPLMYRSNGKDIFDIFRENQDNYFMMYTNSTLINRDTAKKLAETGNVTPAISVEGWEEQTDARRGKGVFRHIQQAMDNLAAEGVPFGISVTAMRQNAEVVLSDEFMDYYYNQKGAIYGWIFQYMPIGRSFTVDLMVTPEQRQWMLEKQLDLIYNKKLFIIDFWNGGPMSVGCISAGRPGGYFYIDWDGNIAPCVFFPYHLGNINDLYQKNQTLTDILMSDYFKSIRSWQESYSNRKNGGQCNGKKMNNMFTPCPMRDHYQFSHETITRFGAKPMDRDAARALLDPEYKKKLMAYDRKIKKLLDPVWEKEIYSS
jgi:MoaA/NifB/PqqE/SkfB family radical SAM enzyme